jgi:carotene biosynthesis associated membrane protein
MSVRVYSGPHADRRRGGPGGFLRALPWLLALITIGAQIAWPLTSGSTRDTLTVVTVVLFFLTSASHALIVRGWLWALGWFVISAGIGFLAELAGTRTDLPFGDYAYADRLGPMVAGVPVIIPLAWAMMSYPALLAARRLVRGPLATAVVAAVALASWDLFLDPQMVSEGHWTWSFQNAPVLLGIDGIPLQNFVGWLLVSFVLMLLLDRLPRRRNDGAEGDGVPALMYLWTYVSSVLLNAIFVDRPGVAIWGGIVMGLVAIPYAYQLWTGRD